MSVRRPWKNARRKLEISMAPAMLCKRKKYRTFSGMIDNNWLHLRRTSIRGRNLVAWWNPHESTRTRAELSQTKHHEDHIAGRGVTSVNHHNLVYKFIQMPTAIKIPDAKAAVDKEWKKLETIPAWKREKVRSKKEVILEAQRGKRSPLCFTDGHLSLEKCGVGTETSDGQRTCGTPWWHYETWLMRLFCNAQSKDRLRHKWPRRKLKM